MGKSLEEIEEYCSEAGFPVIWTPTLPASMAGAWDHRSGLIWIRPGITTRQARTILAHELQHALRGDEGPQPAHIEWLVDQLAARWLISPAEYAAAEAQVGPTPGALAAELETTVRCIRAWQAAHHNRAIPPLVGAGIGAGALRPGKTPGHSGAQGGS